MYKREMHRRMDYPRKATTHIIAPTYGGSAAIKKDFESLHIGDPRPSDTQQKGIRVGRGLPKTTLKFKY